MEKSEIIVELAKALSLFQTKMEKIDKTASNPFFKSKYASLSSILEAIQIPLAESGLVFSQHPDKGELTTILIHTESGQYMMSSYDIHPVKVDPQGIGSAITYAKRYALCAILGLNVDEVDTDGNDQQSKYEWKFPAIAEIKSLSDLEKYWNEHPLDQKDKIFQNEVAKRKGQL
jgi:hypothetical protein